MTTSLATLPAAADGLTPGPSITIRADFVPGDIVMESERTVPNTATASSVPDFGGQYEAVGIFDSYDELEVAIDALLTAGFARCELSLAAEQSGGQATESAEALADDPAAKRTDHFCTEALGNSEGALIGGFAVLPALGTALGAAAAGASIVATTVAVAVSGGTAALIGAGLAALIVRNRKHGFREQQEHGGLLLWVATRSPEQQQRALTILRQHAAHHVHSHDPASAWPALSPEDQDL